MDLRFRSVRDNRDSFALLAWQLEQQWEDFIPTPLGEAKRWLESIARHPCSESVYAQTILEELELN